MIAAEIILVAALAYLQAGLAVGVPFVWRGVSRVDEAARGTPAGFRLLILPGVVALWPPLAAKWLKAPRAGGHP